MGIFKERHMLTRDFTDNKHVSFFKSTQHRFRKLYIFGWYLGFYDEDEDSEDDEEEEYINLSDDVSGSDEENVVDTAGTSVDQPPTVKSGVIDDQAIKEPVDLYESNTELGTKARYYFSGSCAIEGFVIQYWYF